MSPAELIASKVISFQARFGKAKSWTDIRDLTVLLLQFPELKTETGAVAEILRRNDADEKVLEFWKEIVAEDLQVEDEDEDLIF